MENKRMIVSIGNDHGGVEEKKKIVEYLKSKGIEVINRGTDAKDSCDYPVFAHLVANDVVEKKADFGILICNSGEGMQMAANKHEGIRAGLIYNEETAHLVKEHNHANVITFGAKFFTADQMIKFIDVYMSAQEQGDRHQRRVDEIEKY